MKKLLLTLALLLAPSFAFAQVTTHAGGTGLINIASGSVPFGSIFNIRMATSSALQFNNSESRLTVTNASTTAVTAASFYLSGVAPSNCLHTTTSGLVTGTGSDCGSGGGSAFPFTPTTNFGVDVNATSTPLWFQAGFMASSTSYLPMGIWTSTGLVGIGTVTPTDVNANARLTVAGPGSQDIIASTTDNTTLSDAILQAYAPGSRVFLGAHGTNQVSSRFGITLGGWGEIGAFNSTMGTTNGLIIGTQPAVPLVLGTNNQERIRIDSAGKVGVGSTTPFAFFSIHASSTGSLVSNTLFAIGSSTANSTTTLFKIDNAGNLDLGTSTNGFHVVNNAATAGNGLSITTTAAGSGVTLSAISANASETLTIQSKANTLNLNTSNAATAINIQNAGTNRLSVSSVSATFTPSATALASHFTYTGPLDTAITASAEIPSIAFNMAQTRTHANGTLALQRDFLIQATNHAMTSFTSGLITDAATLSVTSGPRTGTNATTTNSYAFLVGSSTASTMFNASTTNSYGLAVFTSAGAANTYSAIFNGGNVGVGTTSPFSKFSISANNSDTNTTLFAIGSSTATATSTLFSVANTGAVFASSITSATAGTNQAVCFVAATGEIIRDTTGTCVVSSERFKHDIKNLAVSGISLLEKLRTVTFTPNDNDPSDYENSNIGFIAEEVAAVDPHLVKYGTDGLPRTLDDRGILSVVVKSVQELVLRVIGVERTLRTQETKIKELEARLTKLEKK